MPLHIRKNSPMHILLAEDNEANRLLACSLLEREGHTLDFAENGQAALVHCENKKYDLILMDILMPVMDGVKALRRLRRSDGPNAITPIFALTGYSSPADQRRYRQVGFDVVLSKPLKPNILGQAWECYIKGDDTAQPDQPPEVHTEFDKIDFVDSDVIRQLLQSASAHDISFIATRFWDSTKAFIAVMQENLTSAMRGQTEALTALRRSAHGIKGSAATLGLPRLSNIAARLQNAPPNRIGALVLTLTDTVQPTAQSLEHAILKESEQLKTDFAATRSDGANALTKSSQTLPSQSKSQSRHRISTAKARPQQAQVP